ARIGFLLGESGDDRSQQEIGQGGSSTNAGFRAMRFPWRCAITGSSEKSAQRRVRCDSLRTTCGGARHFVRAFELLLVLLPSFARAEHFDIRLVANGPNGATQE